MTPEKHSEFVNMDIESLIAKRFRKAIEEYEYKKAKEIDRELVERLIKDNK